MMSFEDFFVRDLLPFTLLLLDTSLLLLLEPEVIGREEVLQFTDALLTDLVELDTTSPWPLLQVTVRLEDEAWEAIALAVTTDSIKVVILAIVTWRAWLTCFLFSSAFTLLRPASWSLASLRFSRAAFICFLRASLLALAAAAVDGPLAPELFCCVADEASDVTLGGSLSGCKLSKDCWLLIVVLANFVLVFLLGISFLPVVTTKKTTKLTIGVGSTN